ncbi:hypothetical protein AB1398_07310 [Hydrogenibacillus schlegelii]
MALGDVDDAFDVEVCFDRLAAATEAEAEARRLRAAASRAAAEQYLSIERRIARRTFSGGRGQRTRNF